MPYVYVLHFDEPLRHSRHYVGSTNVLQKRLISHARGTGSRLCEVLHERQMDWRLATLYVVNSTHVRKLERYLKSQHNGPRYCNICSKCPPRLDHAKTIDLSNVPFNTTSEVLRGEAWPIKSVIRPTDATDGPTIDAQLRYLMSSEKEALGFIPVGGPSKQGLNILIPNGQVLVSQEPETKAIQAYLAWTKRFDGTQIKVQQLCVDDQYRNNGIGRSLIQRLTSENPGVELRANVRNDLPACDFWTAIGFQLADSFPHKTSGSTLNQYILEPGDMQDV